MTGKSLPCGCRWKRDPAFGDVLIQCAEHERGAPHESSEPMTPDGARDFAEGLGRALKTRVVVF